MQSDKAVASYPSGPRLEGLPKMATGRHSTGPIAATHLDFRRVALQRLEDARTLLHAPRTTGALYLAGYAVECMLKAMVLYRVPSRERNKLLADFRGRIGHSLEGLRQIWVNAGGEPFSRDASRAFASVVSWSTAFRYVPGAIDYRTSEEFLNACDKVLEWADERIAHG
jgi:hypothetical protein